ncbi:TPA: hypothetical protein KOY50_000470 [Clostridioides difficile]|uniref:hypothetical protein n=1 Tax=Clostridioides difficile TaxID=1496 RepID=UPI00038DA847|nr:hypothetical protein [Clostridioides difficile]EGT5281276.1 hypothetical protein [Clostridioides difficile]EQK07333.1 putative lipoprotein [Clostridioides difficile P59]MBG0191674.1 hypothetical protein [Clostridioides difficile]MBH7223413.1 hypothetical protein [Clostridioides difficile]MBY1574236.1 hypothetical protein [Clostridioides difficile]
MKVKRNINRVAIIVALNLSLALMAGCMSPVSDKNLSSSEQISKDSLKEQVEDKKEESIELFNNYSQKINDAKGREEVKKDLSQRFSKAIIDSGYSITDSKSDGSFVVSINGAEKLPEKNIRSLFYSMSEDDKEGKVTIDILCAKEYPEDDKLSESDKYIKFIYNLFKSLTNTNLTEKEIFSMVEEEFNKGVGVVELPYMKDIHVEVNKVKQSTKVLKLSLVYKFDISNH